MNITIDAVCNIILNSCVEVSDRFWIHLPPSGLLTTPTPKAQVHALPGPNNATLTLMMGGGSASKCKVENVELQLPATSLWHAQCQTNFGCKKCCEPLGVAGKLS